MAVVLNLTVVMLTAYQEWIAVVAVIVAVQIVVVAVNNQNSDIKYHYSVVCK